MPKTIIIVMTVLCLGGCAAFVATSGGVAISDAGPGADVSLNAQERTVIRDYFRAAKLGSRGLPAGVGKNGRLPDRVTPLPLPPELERRLRPLPVNYRRGRVGRDIVVFERDSRVIADVMTVVGGG